MKYTLVFHESFGHLPREILDLVLKRNVSQSDWVAIRTKCHSNWPVIDRFIRDHTRDGMYIEPWPFPIGDPRR